MTGGLGASALPGTSSEALLGEQLLLLGFSFLFLPHEGIVNGSA